MTSKILSYSGAIALGLAFGLPMQSVAADDPYADAVGYVAAAYHIQRRCDGFKVVGGGGYQELVITASDMLVEQGFRVNKVRKYLFYGKSEWIDFQMQRVLADRNIPAYAPSQLCPFARKIAGKNDTIGRFLVKE